MNSNSSENIPNKITAVCPRCGYKNIVDRNKLQCLYDFWDTPIKQIYHCECGYPIDSNYFVTEGKTNTTTMHG